MQAAPFVVPEPFTLLMKAMRQKSLGRSLAAWRISNILEFSNNI